VGISSLCFLHEENAIAKRYGMSIITEYEIVTKYKSAEPFIAAKMKVGDVDVNMEIDHVINAH